MEHEEFNVDDIPFGPVYIAGGRHLGKIGYYDDDEGKKAIIYFDVPFISDYTFVNRKYLRPVEFAGLERIAEYAEKERMWFNKSGHDLKEQEPIDTTSAEWIEKVSKIVSPFDRFNLHKNDNAKK